MLINICHRTEVQKCTVFKIVGDLVLQKDFRTLVNLNRFSAIFLTDVY